MSGKHEALADHLTYKPAVINAFLPFSCYARACLSRPVLEEGIRFQGIAVPTLFRFLAVVALLAGLGFAAMFALATFVEPQPREMSTTIPANRLPAR